MANIIKETAKKVLKKEYQTQEQLLHETLENYSFFKERLAELELSLEDVGYVRLSSDSATEFSRQALKTINALARIYYLKNPLIQRAVVTQTFYVFGQGFSLTAEHPFVNEVIQDFLNDDKNKAELTEHQQLMTKETELQLFANIFFVFFTDKATGRVRIRTIPVDEIADIITDPEDNKTPLYYKRVWTSQKFQYSSGQYVTSEKTSYYPDWKNKAPVLTIEGKAIETSPIYHVSVNRLSDMKFGVSEVYSGLDWARAYKEFLENWSSIIKAYSRFAWNLTTKGGKGAIASAKDKLQSSISGALTDVRPPVTASTFIAQEGVTMQPFRTSGATTSADDGRRLVLMVCSATGIFEHYLTGDPSTGNLATAKSMERPMEIMFRNRQQLWGAIYEEIAEYVVEQSIKAPRGKLNKYGSLILNIYGEEEIIMKNDTTNPNKDLQSKPINLDINANFPDILEKDTAGRIDAIIASSEVAPSGILPDKAIAKMLLQALGEPDVNEILDIVFPNGENYINDVAGKETPPAASGEPQTPIKPPVSESIVNAVKRLRNTLNENIRNGKFEL